MPATKQLVLSENQKRELEAWTKNPPKPYLRRKAWALLLVAQGRAAYEAAQDRRVHANRTTVSEWIEKFQRRGLEGLKQAKGQGRKPRFFPSPPE
jgi:transposase